MKPKKHETQKAVIDMSEYNDLLGFKEQIMEGKTHSFFYGRGIIGEYFYTKDETIQKCNDINNTLKDESDNISETNKRLVSTIQDLKSEIESIKEMSLFNFFKFKKQ